MRCLFTKVKHFCRLGIASAMLCSFYSTKVNAQCYPLPIAPGMTINCGQTTGLYASDPNNTNGINFLWYDVPVGGVPLDTGNMFVTPVLTQNKTYYVEMNDLVVRRDTFYFTGSLQYYTVPANITMLDVDMYGAQGSGALSVENAGGLGGRVRFTMPILPGTTLYLAVGGKGNLNQGGYNGGGGCTTSPCNAINAYGGGGASDIRTSFNSSDRIAVAGGGGGAGFFGAGVNAQGGAGGGLIAGDAIATPTYINYIGKAGTQLNGGLAGTVNTTASGAIAGSVFQGGNINPTSAVTVNYGGGGGGWYGGGAGSYSGSYGGGGGGGSSYVDHSFYNVSHQQGVNAGDGMIIISYGEITCSSNRLPVDVFVNQNIVTPIVSGVSVMCGDTAIIQASGSVGLFEWYDSYSATTPIATGSSFSYGPVMNNKTFYVRSVDNYANPVCVSEKIAVLVEVFPISRPIATAIINTQCGSSAILTASGSTGNYWWYDAPTGGNYLGKGNYNTPNLFADTTFYYVEAISSAYPYVLDSIVFDDHTSLHSWTVPFGVDSIDVDVYGAQGGSFTYGQGGLGGRVKARIPVTPGQALYIGVGAQPGVSISGGVTGGVITGGNGYSSSTYSRAGGGLSDIRLINGTPTSPSQILVVAGAGGGAGYYTTSNYVDGGAGGDTVASAGNTTFATPIHAGQGGTQIDGGLGGNNSSNVNYKGNFYKGGNAMASSTSYPYVGGGGGGFYGGGGSYANGYNTSSGGGGSSYTTPEASNVQHFQGVNTGNGKVVIYYPRLVTYCSSERTKVAVVTNQLSTPIAINDTVVCADSAVIGATGSTGNYRWFVNSNDYHPFSTDSVLKFANLQNDTTLYVEAVDAPVSRDTLVFNYINATQEWIVPADVYEIEVELYGAQGGSNGSGIGGFGAKVSGILHVTPGQTLNLNVGQQPTSTTGGNSGAEKSGGDGFSSGRGGGGASDIRINGNSLNDRVIVAGAGGGNGANTASSNGGSAGGNNPAEDGKSTTLANVGGGATQFAAGTGGAGLSDREGSFGLGGDRSGTNNAGGGGGGWYGGGSGYSTNTTTNSSVAGGGGGGSSYADPAWVSDIVYVDGAIQQHQGNGKIVIKYNQPYCASNRIPVHIKVNTIADPVVQTAIIDCGDSAVLNVSTPYKVKWFRNATDTTPFVEGPSLVTTKKYTHDTLYVQAYREYYTQGDGSDIITQQFDYSGAMETFVVPEGVYEIDMELLGAQGGSYTPANANVRGGYGAKVSGKMDVIPGQTLYISVGEQPQGQIGGFNGGGNAGTTNINAKGGGGASDIRVSGSTLANRIIVAAGGGGNGWYSSTSYYTRGGYGGQTGDPNTSAAENGYGSSSTLSNSSNGTYGGFGASISIPGQGNTSGTVGTSGQTGIGGNGASVNTSTSGGGGGGGYYGGGGGGGAYSGGGGGGSSFADPNIVSNIVYTNGGSTSHTGHGKIVIRYAKPVYNICESNKVPYIIFVDSLAAPTVAGSTTICNQGSTTFTATGGSGAYRWYENDSLVATAPTYTTGNRTASTNVKVNYVSAQGCVSSFANGQLDIVNLPAATIASAPSALCISTDSVQLTTVTPGGSWIGTGITNAGYFKPSMASIGSNAIIYSIYDGNSNCFNNDTVIIVVDDVIAATITSTPQALCQTLPSVTLSAQNAGGTWIGNGVVNSNEFSPSTAGIGTHKVFYELTNGMCVTKDSIEFIVTTAPVVQITNAPAQLCLSAAPIQLTSSTNGGTWSGVGVSSNGSFDPIAATVGNHRVYYSLNSNGCSAIDSADIMVTNAPIAQISTPAQSVCITSNPVALQASPNGGSWSGNGVVGNDFDPRILTAGSYKLYYQISSGGCTSVDTVGFDVVAMPSASIIAPSNNICESDVNITLQTITAGGLWSGNYISANGQFDVTAAGVGTHKVYYNVSNIACSDIDSFNVVVNALPIVNVAASTAQICSNSPVVQYSATPAGGTWSGAGIVNAVNGTFSPAVATVGNHELYYTFTDAVGCTAIDTMEVEVASIPVANFITDNGCVDQSVSFTDLSTNQIGAIATWNWSFGNDSISLQQHPSNNYSQAGTYIVTLNVSTAAGCSNSITKSIQIGNVPDASFNAVLLNDFTTVNFYPLNPEIGANYLWTFGDGYSASTINASHTYELAGDYYACLTVEKNGCSQKVCNDVTTSRNVSIDEKNKVAFNVYPNPFVNQVNIQIKQANSDKVYVSLYDITGRMIIAPKLISNGIEEQVYTLQLDEFNLSDGVYNIIVHIDGVAHSTLLIKK